MSNLSKFKPDFTAGHQRYSLSNNALLTDYVKCDRSVLSQAENPEAFSYVGLIPNGTRITANITLPNTSDSVRSITYGNGYYVLVSASTGPSTGTSPILYSVNGTTWTTPATGATYSISSYGDVTYGNNQFVVVGGLGLIRTASVPPTDWTDRSSGTTSYINKVTYGNGLYVYTTLGSNPSLATSTDAITWTARTPGTTSSIYAITYGNGLYIYAGAGGALATSTDAITWTARISGTSSAILALIYGNGLYVYAGQGGVLATSTDAITWTSRTSGTTSNIRTLAYGNGVYIYGGDNALSAVSVDSINWKYSPNGVFALPSVLASSSTSTYNDITLSFITAGLNSRYLDIRANPIYTYNPSTDFIVPSTINISQSFGFNPTAYLKYK